MRSRLVLLIHVSLVCLEVVALVILSQAMLHPKGYSGHQGHVLMPVDRSRHGDSFK